MASPKRKLTEDVKREVPVKKTRTVLRATKKTPLANKKKTAAKTKTIKKAVVKKVSSPPKTAPRAIKSPLQLKDLESETVFVPSTASLRLLEKVELYKLWYEKELPKRASYFAKITGYTFLILGGFFAAYSQLVTSNVNNSAALVCGNADCVEVADNNLSPEAPLVTFLNTTPDLLTTDVDLIVRATDNAVVYLEGIESGKKYNLTPIETINSNEVRYLIVVNNLEAGSYIVKARVEKTDSSYIFLGSQFKVEGAKKITPVKAAVIEQSELDVSSSTSSSSADTADISEEVDEVIPPVNTEVELPLSANVESLVDANFLRISTGDFSPQTVYIYSKPLFSTEAIFLGQATLVQGSWIFSLDAVDLPRLEHELYGEFEIQGRLYKTPAAKYLPALPVNPVLLNTDDLKMVVEKVDLALSTAELKVNNRNRYFTYIASTTANFFETNNESSFASLYEIQKADEVLDGLQPKVDDALLRYAGAVQGGQKYLLTIASLAHRQIYTDYLRDNNYTNPTIETILSQRFRTLRDRVKEEEERIIDETNTLTMRDTDGDGVGDFDEISTFKTDANRTDTDRDGVLDGIEMVTGSNPAVADVESLPGKVSVTAELIIPNILEIKSIEGLRSANQGQGATYPMIKGKTIPYATVWLDFPTLGLKGVIRANSQGVFVYTLEQEVVDGNHTVSAFLSDTKGNAVVMTSAHEFSVDKNKIITSSLVGGAVVSEQGEKTDFSPITAASAALVAFGILLLLLSLLVKPQSKGTAKLAV